MSPSVSIHLTVNSLARKRGGLVNAVMRRANALADSGRFSEVWIEVLSTQPWLDQDVASLKASGHLYEKVRVRSVLRVLDTSTAQPRPPRPSLPTGRRISTDANIEEILRDGILRAVARYDNAGRLQQVDHYSPAAVRTRRDEYNPRGRLARILEFTPTGKVGAERVIGRDGRPFLTIHHAGGSPKWTRAYLGGKQLFLSGAIGHVYVKAFARALAQSEAPIIFSEFRENLNNLPDLNLDAIVSLIPHPNLRRVAVGHSNHHAAPYQRGSAITRNWRALLHSVEGWDEIVVWTQQQRSDLLFEYGSNLPIRAIPQYSPPITPSTAPVDYTKVLLVSRLHPKKRVDEAIRVMRAVVDKVPEARLVAFGFGYNDDEQRQIEGLVKELNLQERVVFAGFASDPAEIYDDAAVMLTTSQSEGFSQVLLESFARGVPVVAYDCSYGPREVVKDDVNGYLHPFGDVDVAADSVIRVITDPQLRNRLSQGAVRTAAEFSPDRFVQNWLELCDELAQRPARHIVRDEPGPSAERTGSDGRVRRRVVSSVLRSARGLRRTAKRWLQRS